MIRAVLIDDEILALNLLEAMLNEIGNVDIIGKFLNSSEGLEQIRVLNPDVIFLDIEMPEMNGIKFAESLDNLNENTEIIFVTAYEQYALKAFDVQAAGYILKPIEKSRLCTTVETIQKRLNRKSKIIQEINTLTARLFGSFQLSHEKNGPIKWRTKKVKELCAYFIHTAKPIHRDKILEELWPEHTAERAAALLHTTVYQLRKKFKEMGFEDPVQYREEKYSLNIPVHTDLVDLSIYIQSNQIHEILDLFVQDYLSEEDYQWSTHKRERIRKSVIHSLETYSSTEFMAVHKQDNFRKILEKLYELNPWEERYTLDLVQHYINQGNYKEARDIYNRYKQTLQQELGLNPTKKFEEII